MPSFAEDRQAEGPHLLPLRPLPQAGGLASLLESLAAQVASERRASGLPQVIVTLDASAGRVAPTDLDTLREAVAPLLAAACEAAASAPPRLREVVVTTVDTGSCLEIEVADSGSGPAPAALAAAEPPVARLGGTVACARCPDGGLAVTLRLPHHRLKSRAA
ncbi:MAG: hypothetical protein ACKOCX_02940 [Planctomycetota bacterium]